MNCDKDEKSTRDRRNVTGVAQRTHGTTDPGGVWHPVDRRECLTILLGTYAENGQIIGTDDELHCIRYSLHNACIVPAAYVTALTRSTIALESTGALFHCTLLEVLSRMYFEN